MTRAHDEGRRETPEERADRNWLDLLQELRVSQTGVQLLAGFLVTLPFQSRFTDLDSFQQRWYVGLVGLAFVTVGVTLSPVAIHRRLFREGEQARARPCGPPAHRAGPRTDRPAARGDRVPRRRRWCSAWTAAVGAGSLSLLVLLVLLVGLPRLVAHRASSR